MTEDRRRQNLCAVSPSPSAVQGAVPGRSRRWVLKALAGAVTGAGAAHAQDTGTTDIEAMFRRNTLKGAASSAPAPKARAPLPIRRIASPDFAGIDPARSYFAGIRPWRDGGMRLGHLAPFERDGRTRHLIHNYGHGGAGISLAFGTAETVRGHVDDALAATPGEAGIAVVGAGIIGLTSALAISERHPKASLTIYARATEPEHTTSWLAGGQFAQPSTLAEYHTSAQRAVLDKHLALTEKQIEVLRRAGRADRYGIARRTSYSLNPDNGHDVRLQTGKALRRASSYETWLIDPRRLLPALHADLAARGVRFVARSFETEHDLFDLPEAIIVNCTGFGARDLVRDMAVEGRRGHLVILDNPGRLDYFLNSWCGDTAPRYLFARHADIVIGGTSWNDCSRDAFDAENASDVRAVERIVASARELFETSRGCG